MVGENRLARMNMIRTFVAVDLDTDLRKTLGWTQVQVKDRIMPEVLRLAPDVRIQWVRPDAVHLTLKFLGDIAEARVEEIHRALSATVLARPRFSVEVKGLGVFPDLRAPRVLWVGLSGQPGQIDSLVRLAEDVDVALHGLGFPRELKPFSPHLTLARIKERSRDVGKALAGSGLLTQMASLGSCVVHAVALMKSDLTPSGAIYTRLWEVPLGEA